VSDQEIRDLWDAMDAVRRAVNEQGRVLERIETQLIERCGARLKTLDDHERRIKDLERNQTVLAVKVGLITAAFTVLFAAGVTQFIRWVAQ
jgi:hypothetical protein